MNTYPNGQLFSPELSQEIKNQFYYVDSDELYGNRLFFDNAGGAFRLKKCVEVQTKLEPYPDCPERTHKMSYVLQDVMKKGQDDIRIIFNAPQGGGILTSLTASQVMYKIIGTIADNVKGSNMITTVLEHPSSFDATRYHAMRTNRELRVIPSDPATGTVKTEDVLSLIDDDTVVLNVMYASNLTGGIFNIEEIVTAAREKRPDLFIVVDAVQHAPHGIIDLQQLKIDGINIAPYKFFGCRGSGIGFVSDRVCALFHEKLVEKSDEVWALGTPQPSQFGNITEIVNYVTWIGQQFSQSTDRRELFVEGMQRIKLQERALLYTLLEGTDKVKGLRHIKNVNVLVDAKDLTKRDLIIAMNFNNIKCAPATEEYEKRNVIVAPRLCSSMYSQRMLESFDIEDGAIRVSPLHCNTVEDIEQFLQITEEIANL